MTNYGVGSCNADNSLVGGRAEGIIEERGYACDISGFGLTTKAIVRNGDSWGAVGVDCIGEVAPVIVRVVGSYSARPSALREFAVGGVGVCRTFAVGVNLVGHGAGGNVVEPCRDVARVRAKRLVAVSHHRNLVAKYVISVANRIRRSAFVGLPISKVVFIDGGITERISDRGEIAELVVGVSGSVTEGINGGSVLTKGVILSVTSVTPSVGVCDSATEWVVGDGVGHGRNRHIHQRDAVARKRHWLVGRVGKRLTRSDERRVNQRFILCHIAAHVGGTRTRGKRRCKAG